MNRMQELVHRSRSTPRRLFILLIINSVGLTVAIVALVYVVTRPLSGTAADGLTLDGETLLQEQAAAAGRAIRDPAPGFTPSADGASMRLSDLAGNPVSLGEYLGRPVWITFWATYCHACQREEPDLRRVYASHATSDLVILAIDVGEDTEVVRQYVDDRDLPWTVLLDLDGSAVAAYGTIGTPTHYFVDRQGIIRSRAFGALSRAQMEGYVAGIEDRP
jgi:cytochrome c biogenesis protein CcmG/thiol:disulfide interchange protein DsbE